MSDNAGSTDRFGKEYFGGWVRPIGPMYYCSRCDKFFLTLEEARNHCISNHVWCGQCEIIFVGNNAAEDLVAHNATHHGQDVRPQQANPDDQHVAAALVGPGPQGNDGRRLAAAPAELPRRAAPAAELPRRAAAAAELPRRAAPAAELPRRDAAAAELPRRAAPAELPRRAAAAAAAAPGRQARPSRRMPCRGCDCSFKRFDHLLRHFEMDNNECRSEGVISLVAHMAPNHDSFCHCREGDYNTFAPWFCADCGRGFRHLSGLFSHVEDSRYCNSALRPGQVLHDLQQHILNSRY